MKKFLLAALPGLFLVSIAWAQAPPQTADTGFKIIGRIRGLSDTTCVLAHYFGATQYIPKDTARVDAAGNVIFEGKKSLPEGLFLVVVPKKGYLQFLITEDQQFSFDTDTANVAKSMKVTGSKENELFYAYQQQLGKLSDEAQALNLQKKIRNDAVSTAMLSKQMNDLQKQAADYRNQFLKENAGTFAARLFNATAEPEVPPAP